MDAGPRKSDYRTPERFVEVEEYAWRPAQTAFDFGVEQPAVEGPRIEYRSDGPGDDDWL